MRFLALGIAIILFYMAFGVYLSHYDLRIIPIEVTRHHTEGFHDYSGVINVHSVKSTGSGSILEIIDAAQRADLDFIFITDLNQFDETEKSFEGYYENLLVFVDGEYSYLNSRLLNLDVSARRDFSGPGRAQVLFAELLNQLQRPRSQGLFVLAHPLKPRFSWTGEFPKGLDGLEIINLKSLWQVGWIDNKLSFIWSLFIFPFNERLALLRLIRDPLAEVRLWDDLAARRPTLGFAGTDAEAKIRMSDSLTLRYPTYESLFSLARNHVLLNSELTGDLKSDKDKISAALRNGNFYLSLDILADPTGFLAKIISDQGDVFAMGSTLNWRPGLELSVHLPNKPAVPFETEIFRNGERLVQSNSQDTRIPLHQPGIYRVKVRVIPTLPLPDGKKWIPWIFTNPFYVR